MRKMLHISDLHIHKDNSHPDNVNTRRLFEHIVKALPDNKVVLITGDITDDGQPEQYYNAYQLIKILDNMKVLIVPGNHDYGPTGNVFSKKSKQLFKTTFYKGKYPRVDVVNDIVFIGLDSNGKGNTFATGNIGIRQRSKLKKLIKQYEGYEIVVYLHHHPFYRNPFQELHDADKLMKILSGKISCLCFGHKHKQELWKDKFNISYVQAEGKSPDEFVKHGIIVVD